MQKFIWSRRYGGSVLILVNSSTIQSFDLTDSWTDVQDKCSLFSATIKPVSCDELPPRLRLWLCDLAYFKPDQMETNLFYCLA